MVKDRGGKIMSIGDLLNTVKNDKVLLDEVDRFLASKKKKPRGVVKDSRETGVWHVSQLHSCSRSLLFGRLGFKSNNRKSARGEKIFDTGHSFGYTAQEYLYYMGILYGEWQCRSCGHRWEDYENPSPRTCPECGEELFIWINLDYLEVPLRNDELGIAGHADGVIETKGKKRIVELKTIKNRTKRTHPDSVCFEDLNSPKDSHLWQVSMYEWLKGLKYGVVWYRGKNNQQDKEFKTRLIEELHVTPQIEKVKKLNKHLEEKTLPPRPKQATGKSSRFCKWCGYKKICYATEGEQVSDYKEVVK